MYHDRHGMDPSAKRLLVAITLLALAARVLALGSLPRGLHPDEAANALEAWSLAHTGRSTDGRLLPLVFAHHGVSWVEGLYVYLAVPFVGLLGDCVEVAVRLPAALAGTLAVLATFVLGARLAGQRAGLFAAGLLAIEPWAVHHSRFADRAALEPLLLASGLVLAVSGLDRRRPALVAGGGALLGVALATYPPARVVVPLVAIALLLALSASRREAVLLLAPIVVAGLAILPFALSERGLVRLREIGVSSPAAVIQGWAVHYSPRALFSGSVSQGFLARGVPPLHIFEAPLILVGIVAAARVRRFRFLLGWLAAFPLAAAFTDLPPNLLRAIFGLPLFALLGGVGLEALLHRVSPRRVALVLAPVVAASVTFATLHYVQVFPGEATAWSAYASEREEVANMHGRVKLTKPHERALVDLHARSRPHRWIADDEVVFGD